MSVVGIDLGATLSKVAVVGRGKVEMVPNDLSKLLTSTLVGFTPQERHVGESATSSWSRNYRNTVAQATRLLGRQRADPTLDDELKKWFSAEPAQLEDGRVALSLETSQGKIALAPEQILAPFLAKLKESAQRKLQGPVKDCVVACPDYFDDAQRRALLTAAKLAGLNVLRLLNATTATSINYGFLRQLSDETKTVVIVDVGYTHVQVAVVDFKKGECKVRGTASDPNVGTRDFDYALYQHFAAEFQSKHGINLDERARAKLRLLREVVRVKKLLSGNRDAVHSVECLADDLDFTLRLTRDDFESMVGEHLQRMVQPCRDLLAELQLDGATIDRVEVVGGGSRIPGVQQALLAFFKEQNPELAGLSFTMNGDESIAKGAALMCAMLSPTVKARDFAVEDVLCWPLAMTDKVDRSTTVILPRRHVTTIGKPLEMAHRKSFDIKVAHPDKLDFEDGSTVTIEYPFATSRDIGSFRVSIPDLTPAEQCAGPSKFAMLFKPSRHGLLDLPKALLTEQVIKKVKKKKKKKGKKGKKGAKKDKGKGKADAAPKKKEQAEKPPVDEAKPQDAPAAEPPADAPPAPDQPASGGGDGPQPMDVDEPDPAPEAAAASDAQPAEDDGPQPMDTDDAPAEQTSSQDDPDVTMSQGPADGDDKPQDASAAEAEAPPKADAAETPASEPKEEEKEEEMETRTETVTRHCVVTGTFANDCPREVFVRWEEIEAHMALTDRLVFETAERRNELEAFVYQLRDDLDDKFREFVDDDTRARMHTTLDDTESWLYDEGESAAKKVYEEKIKELRKTSKPWQVRLDEAAVRDARVAQLKAAIVKYQQFAVSTEEKYEHLTPEDRKPVADAAAEADTWLCEQLNKQGKRAKTEDPAFLVKDIDAKKVSLMAKCEVIVNKPKPKPKTPTPPPKEEEKPEAKADDASTTADGAADGAYAAADAVVGDLRADAADAKEADSTAASDPPPADADAAAAAKPDEDVEMADRKEEAAGGQ